MLLLQYSQNGQMLFLTGQCYAEADDAADGQHGAARHCNADQTLLLHSLVDLTLKN